jgi:hypothetical protein
MRRWQGCAHRRESGVKARTAKASHADAVPRGGYEDTFETCGHFCGDLHRLLIVSPMAPAGNSSIAHLASPLHVPQSMSLDFRREIRPRKSLASPVLSHTQAPAAAAMAPALS